MLSVRLLLIRRTPSEVMTSNCVGSYKWSGGKSVAVFDSTVVSNHSRSEDVTIRRSLRSPELLQ